MKVIVGPMPCQECKRPVYFAEITERVLHAASWESWRVRAIADRAGNRHDCGARLALLVTAASWSSTMLDARREAVTLATGVDLSGGYGSDGTR